MNTPDTTDTFLDETLKPLGRLRGATTEESSILQKVDFETAKASIKQFIENRVKEARVDELKQLEPPEQYEEYAKLMGSEYCRICGFNAIKFREYITKRLKALPINSLGTLTSINN